jgi:tripartite-type tricarboxylate transporter receptor subunit TctC
MKLPRRRFLHLAAGAATQPALSRTAKAQGYPTRPVRLVVSIVANVDELLVQLVSQRLSERLGQPFVIDNQPSSGTTIGTEAIVNAFSDGHTLALVIAANLIQAILYDKSNFVRDIVPVAGISRNPFVFVVNPSVPAKAVPDFIAYAKTNPGKVSMASSGKGSILHLAGELFTSMAGVNVVHVPYRGMPAAIPDLLTGQVHSMFLPVPQSLPHIKDGKLRGLAVTSATRSNVLPDIPTVGEFVAGYKSERIAGPVRTQEYSDRSYR